MVDDMSMGPVGCIDLVLGAQSGESYKHSDTFSSLSSFVNSAAVKNDSSFHAYMLRSFVFWYDRFDWVLDMAFILATRTGSSYYF